MSERLNGAKTTAQTERNRSANLYFSGTDFLSVVVGIANARAFLRMKVGELPKHLFSSY